MSVTHVSAPRKRVATAALGPAFVAAVAYVDPGNVATNTAAGAGHGFLLLWVVVLASVAAAGVQYSAAKLGLVAGGSLPQLVAARSGPARRLAYWLQAEAVAVATDVAELVGAAVGLHLLVGVPLVVGGGVAAVLSIAVLRLRDRRGAGVLERLCAGSLLVIGASFAVGLVLSPPRPAAVVAGLLPRLAGADTVLLAAGIVGATVMPHAVYLHSALTAERGGRRAGRVGDAALTWRLRATRWDVGLAMTVAGTVNVAMLVVGAVQGPGGSTAGLSATFTERVGSATGLAFAVALTVSGLASTVVGAHAGAVVWTGLIRRPVSATARRLVAIVPALALLAVGGDPVQVLVLSQVALALGLPFALVPLVRWCADREVMGPHVHRQVVTVALAAVAAVVVLLDLALVVLVLGGAS